MVQTVPCPLCLHFCCVIWVKTMLSWTCRAERLSHFAVRARAFKHGPSLIACGTWLYGVATNASLLWKTNLCSIVSQCRSMAVLPQLKLKYSCILWYRDLLWLKLCRFPFAKALRQWSFVFRSGYKRSRRVSLSVVIFQLGRTKIAPYVCHWCQYARKNTDDAPSVQHNKCIYLRINRNRRAIRETSTAKVQVL